MQEFYSWKPEYLEPVTGIAASTIGFIIYWFLALSPKIKAAFFLRNDPETAWIKFVFFQKMAGVVFCGIVPAIVCLSLLPYSLADYGIKLGNWGMSLKWGGIMCVLILIINYFATKNPENLKNYPQMRLMEWGTKRILTNSLAWTAYLLAYEFMFRGILLISCYHALGFWPAVAVNLSLYSATHIPKGLNETIGAIPYGLLLCYVTIASGSITVSFITHLALALSNDYFSVHHSREMKFIR